MYFYNFCTGLYESVETAFGESGPQYTYEELEALHGAEAVAAMWL